MTLFAPTPPPYDPLAWSKLPLAERGRMVCEAWALQVYGTPPAVHVVYLVKILLYVGGWIAWCGTTPGLGSLATIDRWWLEPIAFQKAILWSALFEGLGFGCGSGPLTGRYLPPVGGALYFLRPGTTKLPMWPRLPLVGGARRTWLDVAVYAAVLALLVVGLASAAPSSALLGATALTMAALALCDRTAFLAFRPEHYATTIAIMAMQPAWIAGAKGVQLALWFWAGFSKLNHHFPTVVCVMTSNGPLTPWAWLRRRMYVRFPDDLRPSRLAVTMGHLGTALELAVPITLALAPGGWSLTVGLTLMVILHAYITSNVPMGVPLEWNVMVVYGAFALFGAHPDVRVLDVGLTPAAALLVLVCIVGPLVGNLWPHRLSFLLSMRYYAGNWASSVWLFRGDAYRKLDRLTTSAPWVHDQLARFYDRATAIGLVGKVIGFRLMHLHGRALPRLVPRAVARLEAYEWVDGEIVAGLVLGWNFGDGHLHDEKLVRAIQPACQFEPGELRCIFLEAQPLGRGTQAYRIVDAATGLVEAGELSVADLRRQQPWACPPPEQAAAVGR